MHPNILKTPATFPCNGTALNGEQALGVEDRCKAYYGGLFRQQSQAIYRAISSHAPAGPTPSWSSQCSTISNVCAVFIPFHGRPFRQEHITLKGG